MLSPFRTTPRLFATHVGRTPSIHFPDRKQPHPHHDPSPHPAAPQSIIDQFTQFRSKQASDGGIPLAGPAGGAAKGRGFESTMDVKVDVESEWELPERFLRSRYVPSEEEMEAVLSGGASVAPEVTKASKEKWWTAQV